MSSLLRILRKSGKCPPTFLANWRSDEFEAAVMRIINPSSENLSLLQDPAAGDGFVQVVKIANAKKDVNRKLIEQRRSVVLAIIKATTSDNFSLRFAVNNGFLKILRTWMEEIVGNIVGGVDLLLHLLDSFFNLPVTKDLIASSGLGKAILQLEKHKICVAGRNEIAIKARTKKLKDQWGLLTNSSKPQDSIRAGKRFSTDNDDDDRMNKRSKLSLFDTKETVTSTKRKFSTASLIGKVSRTMEKKSPESDVDKLKTQGLSAAELARLKAQERQEREKARFASIEADIKVPIVTEEEDSFGSDALDPGKRATKLRWADELGQSLVASELADDGKNIFEVNNNSLSLSERRKKDLLMEREMMNNARKSIGDDISGKVNTLPVTISWRKPSALTPYPGMMVQAFSNELTTQTNRLVGVQEFLPVGDFLASQNPKPLSDSSIALDTASMISTATQTFPFFVSPPEKDVLANVISSLPTYPQYNNTAAPNAVPIQSSVYPIPAPASSQEASLEFVQSQGLPQFLVGSNVKALQTLTSTPGLVDSYSNQNGTVDEFGLSNLVNTLTKNLTAPSIGTNLQSNNSMQYGAPISMESNIPKPMMAPNTGQVISDYKTGNLSPQFQSLYKDPSAIPSLNNQSSYYQSNAPPKVNGNGFRGDQNSEANLHVTGYGPSTTEADLRAIFAPYVAVLEVAMKNGFAFVNTGSVEGARRARESLSGTIVGGRPIRINLAAKKAFEPEKKGNQTSRNGRNERTRVTVSGHTDYDKIRDERGNPATKNLFVAGFGAGTTDQQLFELFNQLVTVTGTVHKGTFAFINTIDKASACKARDALSGTFVNGGSIRINFAKESGKRQIPF